MTPFICGTLIGVNMQQKGIETEDIRTNNKIKLWKATEQIRCVIEFNDSRMIHNDITENEEDYLKFVNKMLRHVIDKIDEGGF